MNESNWLAMATAPICTKLGARQFGLDCVISSELGELSKQPSLSYLASNDEVICKHIQQIMFAIGDTWSHMIESTDFRSSFKIYTKTIGTFFDRSFVYEPGQPHFVLKECKTYGISINFCNVPSPDKTKQFRCISLSYLYPHMIKINAETLMPDFYDLVFTDINSVIITIDQIMKEVFCKPIVPKLIESRMPLLVINGAIMEEQKKNKSTNKIVLFLNKKFWVRAVTVFLYTDN